MKSPAIDGAPRVDRAATLIVTRPALDAAPLVAALRARGRKVIGLPILAIEPVEDPSRLSRVMAGIADYRLVVFVSPNAIRHALAQHDGPWPHHTVIGVMGPGSVAALEGLGIGAPAQRVVSPGAVAAVAGSDRFDSEALFDALDATLRLTGGFDGRALILRGNGGRAWFADRLRELGIAVDEVEAYRRLRPTVDPVAASALRGLAASGAPAAFVVTSSEGVGHLEALVVDALGTGDAARSWLFAATVLAPHRRIAETAVAAGFTDVALCAPGDRGILAAIE